MRVVFFLPSPFGARLLEPDFPEENPLGGTEASSLRLADALRRRGHEVEVLVDGERLPGTRADAFVAVRGWEALLFPTIEAPLRYLWAHDDADQARLAPLRDPALAAHLWERCDGVGLVSRYQEERYAAALHLPASRAFRAGNGLAPGSALPEEAAGPGRPRRCYYASAPFRGLELLLRAWPRVRQAVPDAELAVFSSLRLYNSPDEAGFERLYGLARSLPGVAYHGAVGQRRLREEAARCRALAYPCTFPETSCLAAMEAMAAGCAVVATALGALPETAEGNPLADPADPDWMAGWGRALCRVLLDDAHYAELARRNLRAARAFDPDAAADRWLRRIRDDLRRKHGR